MANGPIQGHSKSDLRKKGSSAGAEQYSRFYWSFLLFSLRNLCTHLTPLPDSKLPGSTPIASCLCGSLTLCKLKTAVHPLFCSGDPADKFHFKTCSSKAFTDTCAEQQLTSNLAGEVPKRAYIAPCIPLTVMHRLTRSVVCYNRTHNDSKVRRF